MIQYLKYAPIIGLAAVIGFLMIERSGLKSRVAYLESNKAILEANLEKQNLAVTMLGQYGKLRAEAAKATQKAARVEAKVHKDRAADIMSLTPEGDRCVAALKLLEEHQK